MLGDRIIGSEALAAASDEARSRVFDGPNVDPGCTERAAPKLHTSFLNAPEIPRSALFIAPGHWLFVIRLTGYLTAKLEGYEK